MKTKTKTIETILARDFKVGDIIKLYEMNHTITDINPFGYTGSGITVRLDSGVLQTFYRTDKVELVGFMLPHFTIPVKPKKKRKSLIVHRVEKAGYSIEKVNGKWEVYHNDDHSVTAIYDRLKDIPLFAPYV